ncbi:GvpL/GvpF family gas vesicle protein [Saccharopolyspora sp. NPDC000359]|uniref:GvpL/GvpF family gas vesicle protein n=1 Tax=Saccharopolyspora sp. NPDC000359 TaxID=3154251 RepID=UPI0033211D6F
MAHVQQEQDPGSAAAQGTGGVYVYGIIRSSHPVPEDLASVGDDDAPVRAVSHGSLSAVISDLQLSRPLGKRDDLLAHEQVLDTLAAETAVVPMRFGGVVASAEEVVNELLAPHEEHFADLLAQLDGVVQFTVRGRYSDSSHIREIVAENPEIGQLRESLRGVPQEEGYDQRLKLGELVSNAVVAKRETDVGELLDALSPHVVATVVREVGGEDDAFDVAVLVEHDRRDAFEEALDELGDRWSGRLQLRLVGPLAPYDFVPEE